MQKLHFAVAYLAGLLAAASVQAQKSMPSEGAVMEPLAKGTAPMTSFSARFGYLGFQEGIFDDGLGGQAEFKMPIDESDFDFVVRGHYAFAELDDGKAVRSVSSYRYGQWYVIRVVTMENCEETVYGGSAQIQYNFRRQELANPYVAAGIMFERTEYEYDIRGITRRHQKGDEDGFALVGRGGVEFKLDPCYVRFAAALFSEIYDEDNWQAELNAIVGAYVTDNIRLDVAGTCFTDWKEYYITAGLTFLF
jgi:opacity protein-like surface antigen